MKKLITLSAAAFMFSLAASAQTDRAVTAPQAEGRQHRDGKHNKGQMMKDLNLSKEQQAQMKANHQEMKAKRDALKAQDNITVKEMRERQKALSQEQKSKMDGILNQEQKNKMAEMRKKKMGERGERGDRKMKKQESK